MVVFKIEREVTTTILSILYTRMPGILLLLLLLLLLLVALLDY